MWLHYGKHLALPESEEDIVWPWSVLEMQLVKPSYQGMDDWDFFLHYRLINCQHRLSCQVS